MCQDIAIDDTSFAFSRSHVSPMFASSVEEFKKYCTVVPFKSIWYFYQVCAN